MIGNMLFGNSNRLDGTLLEPRGSGKPVKKATSRIQATVHKRERDKSPIDNVHSEMLPMSNIQRTQAAQPP